MTGRPSWVGASGNPLLQAASLLVFGLLLIGAVLMGAVIFAIVLVFAAVGAVAFYAQIWWLRRKAAQSPRPSRSVPPGGNLIEAEYTVVEQRDPSDPPDSRVGASTSRPDPHAADDEADAHRAEPRDARR